MHPRLLLFSIVVLAGCRTAAPPPPPEPVRVRVTTVADAPEGLETVAVDKPPAPVVTPGVLESRAVYPTTAVTEWGLVGGARVVFRHSMAEPRRLRLYAFAPGGYRLDADSRAPAWAMQASESHAGASVTARLTADAAVLEGGASTEALAVLLDAAVGLMEGANGARHVSTPEAALDALLSGVPLATLASEPEPRTARALFGTRFGDPGRFTFVIAGDALPEAVEAAAAQVLGRARPSLRAVVDGDRAVPAPTIPTHTAVWTAPSRSSPPVTAFGFRGQVDADYDALAGLDVLAELLARAAAPFGEAEAVASLDDDAGVGEVRLFVVGARAGDARTAIEAAVRTLRREGPTVEAFVEARQARATAHAQALDTNAGWTLWLARLARADHDTREALRYGRRLQGVTRDELRDLAGAVLDPDRMAVVVQPGE